MHTVREMIRIMQSVPNSMNPDQSLTAVGVRHLASHFGLHSDPSLSGTVAGTAPLNENYFDRKLRSGYVLFFYRTPTHLINHMVLVYSCDATGFHFMDSWPPGSHQTETYSSFRPSMYLALWR